MFFYCNVTICFHLVRLLSIAFSYFLFADPQPQPYTIETVCELLSNLIHSLSPEHNKESVISISLGLITIALETGADAIANSPRLLHLVRGDLTKYLMLVRKCKKLLFCFYLRMIQFNMLILFNVV